MSTRANVQINGTKFRIGKDGWDKDGIVKYVLYYAQRFRGKVKTELLPEVMVGAIMLDAYDGESWFMPSFVELPFVDYDWVVTIGPRGGVKIKGGER